MAAQIKFLNSNLLFNLFIFFLTIYLCYHLLFGKYNIGNFLINNFYEKIINEELEYIKTEIGQINLDLNALYTNREDFIDEVTKQRYSAISPGEVLIKID